MNCQYIINKDDRIVFVNDEWDEFAVTNGGRPLLSKKVLYQSIWNFINDLTSVYLYREILKKVRNGQDLNFNIRCDSPSLRRFLEVNITLQENERVLFENRLLKEESRTAQKILESGILRSKEVLIICSWCNRAETGKDKWQEIETAVKDLGLFERNSYPGLSHGMCPDCYLRMSETLDKTE
jgi:hypothetical protein